MPRPDLYISADVETDGPLPGRHSMLSFALAVAGRFDGAVFEPVRAAGQPELTFYRELRPVGDEVVPEALAVSGLDRERLRTEGAEPTVAMRDAAAWVRRVAQGCRPVLVAYPATFDWPWLSWYFTAFAGGPGGNPFGFSGCLDVKTLYQARAGVVWGQAVKRHMPTALRSTLPHTHHALDDALEQAELFANIWRWDGRAGLLPER